MQRDDLHIRTSFHSGFTFVELAIVLVIVGFLSAGIIVGRELIHAAGLQSTVRQIGQYQTAVNAFKMKYNCLPGDCGNAVQWLLGTSGGPGDNGDNNRLIYDVNPIPHGSPPVIARESYNFWYHLSTSMLVTGFSGYHGLTNPALGVDYPRMNIGKGGGIWVSPALVWDHNNVEEVSNTDDPPRKNSFWLVSIDMTVPDSLKGVLQPLENYQIDSKIDDGLPVNGKVTIAGPVRVVWAEVTDTINMPFYGPGGAAAPYCGDTNTNPPTYNTANTSNDQSTLCILRIDAGF